MGYRRNSYDSRLGESQEFGMAIQGLRTLVSLERANLSEANPSLPSPGSFGAWWLAARPATLSAAIVPVLVGTAIVFSEGNVRPDVFALCLLGAIFLQVASNLANDVFDFEKGADNEDRLGPTRAVQAGLLSASVVRRGLWTVLGAALLVGVVLWLRSSSVVVWVGLASMLAAVSYTAGPYPLGYHGLGELFVIVFFGFVAVCTTSFLQLGQVPLLAWVSGGAIGFLAAAILVVNNVRDRETDLVANKRTLAVRWGRAAGLWQYRLFVCVPYLCVLGSVLGGLTSSWTLVTLGSAPLAVSLMRRVKRDVGKALNHSLVGTAKLMLLFGVLLSAGLVIGRLRLGLDLAP